MAEAKLIGASNTTHRILAEVQAAQGKTPDIRPVAETVVPRPVQRQQALPAVAVAPEDAGRVPPPQNAPQTPTGPTIRQAVLTEPERVEFGGEVRVSTVGTWLWVAGPPDSNGGGSSVSWELHKAGGRWSRSRNAWYFPGFTLETLKTVERILGKRIDNIRTSSEAA